MTKEYTFIMSLCLMVYHWIKGIIMVFVPKHLRYKDVKDEVVLITGGGSGLGRLLAIEFAKHNARVILWDINKDGLEETGQMVRRMGAMCSTYICDVSNRNAVYETAKKVKDDAGPVSILINNAGIVTGTRFIDTQDEKLIKTMEVNAMSHFWTCKAFLPDMMESNHGHIVAIASVAGLNGGVRMADYAASKFATIGFEESLRMELRAEGFDGIHSTVVCPWFVKTGMFAGARSEIIPYLEPQFVASSIMSGILINQNVVLIPRFMYFLYFIKSFIPTGALFWMVASLGGTTAMNTFVGRSGHSDFITNEKVEHSQSKQGREL